MKNTKETQIKDTKITEERKSDFVFGKMNYTIMGIGLVVLAIGYILLSGGGSDNPDQFNEALFNSRRMFWAPLFIVGGLAIEVFAIMKKQK